ncbi:hypothetical protein [Armatimonas sp.]|uniref:hypothetical protein n=1 Tax=Armatimonas sp. TaxID=1872638 RepID=UPI00286BE904|nr:hypothetical protein [Armatimonas sp.]
MNEQLIAEALSLTDLLRQNYDGLKAAFLDSFQASEAAGEARRNLASAREEILREHTDPKALGANEAAREARIAELTITEREFVTNAEREERVARFTLDCWRMEVEESRALLRLLEVQAGTVKPGVSSEVVL